MTAVPKKEEQHRLSSDHLDEVQRWKPPRPRKRTAPEQLDGQLDLIQDVEWTG